MNAAFPKPGAALFALLVLTLAVATGAALRGIIGPIQEVVQHDLQLNDIQMSLIQGLAGAIPVALFCIPLGRLIDETKRVRILVLMVAMSTASALLTVFAGGFTLLFVARMLAALGSLGAIQAAISLAADLAPPRRRGRTLLLISLGIAVGNATAFAFGGWLFGWIQSGGLSLLPIGTLAPWRGVHLVCSMLSVIVLLMASALHEPERHELATASPAAFSQALRELWKMKAFLAPIFIGQIAVLMADTAAWIWAAPVLVREHGLRPEQFGGWMGIIIFLSGAAGAIAGGAVADLGYRMRIRGGILIGAVAAAVLSVPASVFAQSPTVPLFALLLALLLFSGAVMALVGTNAIAVSVPNELRGVCVGALFVVSAIGGFGIAPTLVTVLSGILGGGRHLPASLSIVDVTISIIAMVAFAVAMRHAPPPAAARVSHG